jgi:hypothetical protein
LWVASCDVALREQAMRVASQRGYDLGMASNFIARGKASD